MRWTRGGFNPSSSSVEMRRARARSMTAGRLTPGEAKLLVEKSPPVLQVRDAKCIRIAMESTHNADDMWFQAGLDCRNEDVKLFSVNRITGQVIDRTTGRNYESPELQNLRSQILSAAEVRQSRASEFLQTACP